MTSEQWDKLTAHLPKDSTPFEVTTWRERMLLEALQDVMDRKGDWLGQARAALGIVEPGAASEAERVSDESPT